MPSLKLTKRAIEKLSAPHSSGKQTLMWDSELKGFGLLLSGKTPARTYIVQHRLKSGIMRRVTIGPVDVLDLDGEDGVRARARKVLGEFYSGVDPKAERKKAARHAMTLRTTLDTYLVARKGLRPKSVKDYREGVERHLAPWLDRPLREITAEMVEARHAAIKHTIEQRKADTHLTGAPPDLSHRGAATANGVFRTFRLLWNWAVERDPELPDNPTRRLKRAWYPVSRRMQLVRSEDLGIFYRAVDALPNRIHRDYLLLLLFTGLRRSEGAALRWDELDFAEQVIRLPAKRTKAGRRLDLPMTDFVRDLLIARRALGRDAPFVFPANSHSGHPAEPKYPLALVAQATGIVISVHDLRRTHITIAEGADISPLALKALVNHSLGNDVTSGYVQMTVDRLREPAQRVCDRLMELCQVEELAVEKVGVRQ